MAPQASLAPSQAPLAMGALSERLVPPFLQSVHLLASSIYEAQTGATLSAERSLASKHYFPKASCIYEAQTGATLCAKRSHPKIQNFAILE